MNVYIEKSIIIMIGICKEVIKKVVIKKVVIGKIVCLTFMFAFIFLIGIVSADRIKTPVDMDNISPELIYFDYSINHKKVTFSFEIAEDNLKKVYYRDVAECRRTYIKYNTLCTRLSSDGKCFAVRDLCVGKHTMEIIIVDKAKNEFITDSFEFEIE